jgi:hypothetical protein
VRRRHSQTFPLLKGKTIARVDLHPFDDGREGFTTDPCIHFTDGTFLRFVVHETEGCDYGVGIIYPARCGQEPRS